MLLKFYNRAVFSGLPYDSVVSIMEYLKLSDIINLDQMGHSEAATHVYRKSYRTLVVSLEFISDHFYFDKYLDPSQFPAMITRLFVYVGHQMFDLTLDLRSFGVKNCWTTYAVCRNCPTDLISFAPNLRNLTIIECFCTDNRHNDCNRFLESYSKIKRHSLNHLRLVGGFFKFSHLLDNLNNVGQLHIHGTCINSSDAVHLLLMRNVTEISLDASADAFEKVLFPVWGQSNKLTDLKTYRQPMSLFMPHLQRMTNLKRFANDLKPFLPHQCQLDTKFHKHIPLSTMLCNTIEVLELPCYVDLYLYEIAHFDRLKELRIEIKNENVWPTNALMCKQMLEVLSKIPKVTVVAFSEKCEPRDFGVCILEKKLKKIGWCRLEEGPHCVHGNKYKKFEYRNNLNSK